VGSHHRPEVLPPGGGDLGGRPIDLGLRPEDRVVKVSGLLVLAGVVGEDAVAGVAVHCVGVANVVDCSMIHRRRTGTELIEDQLGGSEKGRAPEFYQPWEGGRPVVPAAIVVALVAVVKFFIRRGMEGGCGCGGRSSSSNFAR
jgi:hypothetical protein